MMATPIITSILTVPGTNTTNTAYPGTNQTADLLFVGIEVDKAAISWGTCPLLSREQLSNHSLIYGYAEAKAAIENIVSPALIGQPLTSFREATNKIEGLREVVTIEETIPAMDEPELGVSRREVITAFLSTPELPVTKIERKTVDRRLHPAIRYGVSEALLRAVCQHRLQTAAEILIDEFQVARPLEPVKMQVAVRRGQTLHIDESVASLSYTVTSADPSTTLGENAERIQRFVRQLRSQIASAGFQHEVAIYLNLSGNLGALYENQLGKILGSLYGLEEAAAPGSIYVQDPVLYNDPTSQVDNLAQLHSFMHMRQMSLRLVAGSPIYTTNDIRKYIEKKATHGFKINMVHLGSMQEIIGAVQECQRNDLSVFLEGGSPKLLGQVALVAQPDYAVVTPETPVSSGLAEIGNEMNRTLAWLNRETL